MGFVFFSESVPVVGFEFNSFPRFVFDHILSDFVFKFLSFGQVVKSLRDNVVNGVVFGDPISLFEKFCDCLVNFLSALNFF